MATNKELTSRHWALDAVEVIANCIANCSHLQEQINSVNASTWEGTSEETRKVTELCTDLIKSYTKQRRELMAELRDSVENPNIKYRCAVKHAIGVYGYSTELLYAEPTNPTFILQQQEAAEAMYRVLSAFLGMELTVCGRCLNDDLYSEKENGKEF